jgi:hypothetical protein
MFGRARPGRNRRGRRALGLGLLLLLSAPVVAARAAETPGADPAGKVTPAAPAAGPGPEGQARPAVDFWERLPASTALLVPVAVGLAVLIGLALGPGGRPTPVHRREGGLSRALARRSGDAA